MVSVKVAYSEEQTDGSKVTVLVVKKVQYSVDWSDTGMDHETEL